MTVIQQSWKAIAALLVTALITFLTSTSGGISVGEAARSAGLSFLTAALVWLVPNKPSPLTEIPGDYVSASHRGQTGQGIVWLICTVLGVIMILIGAIHLIVASLNNTPVNWTFDIILIVVGVVLVGFRYYSNGRRSFDGRL